MRSHTIILYGSYGYTGSLIARECRSRGLRVILSGRRRKPLEAQSRETGYPYETVRIDDYAALQGLLQKGEVVIHCAGPFQHTARAMVEACMTAKTHYTDISGEYQVFEMLHAHDEDARKAGITILPGTGFDVVPSDCLAVHLKNQLPGAMQLEPGLALQDGGVSRGTAKTVVQGLGQGSVVRKSGELIFVRFGDKIKRIDFGKGPRTCLNIPWGDVSTAWHSTGIPNIEVYAAASTALILASRLSHYANWLLKARWPKYFLSRIIDLTTAGPAPERIRSAKSLVWGKVTDASGQVKCAVIETPGGYKLTSSTSVLIAEKILAGKCKTGFNTPATAFGPQLILEIENTRLRNL